MKKFEATSMKEALEKIKAEMGPDAFILGTRQITKKGPLGFGDRKFLQVTAAVEEDDIKPAAPAQEAAAPRIDIRQESEGLGKGSALAAAAESAATAPTYTPMGRASTAKPEGASLFGDAFEAVFASAREGGDGAGGAAAKPKPRRKKSEDKTPIRKEIDELKEMVKDLGGSGPDLSPLQKELGELKGLLYNVIKSQTPIYGQNLTPTMLNQYQSLRDSGMDDKVVAKLINIADNKLNEKDKNNAKRVEALMRKMIANAVDVYDSANGSKIQALVGPTGVGKTTTLAKLAANAMIKDGMSVALITLDTFRIAAVEQLKTYAKIMDIPVQAALNMSELRAAIQFHQDKDLILIDSPGRSQKDKEGMATLEAFLSDQPDIDVHLVLSATTKASDLNDIVEKFKALGPKYLIFSKLDETSSYGPLFNQVIKTHLPVSYLTIGQSVPEDLEAATSEHVADLLVGKGLQSLKGGQA